MCGQTLLFIVIANCAIDGEAMTPVEIVSFTKLIFTITNNIRHLRSAMDGNRQTRRVLELAPTTNKLPSG